MQFNLIIIGDEILHGNRQDKHFSFFKTTLEEKGFQLGMVQYLPDDRECLIRQLSRSFADKQPTFITGGIGSTPDDHTRQAAAAALNLPLVRHKIAATYIEQVSQQRGDSLDSAEHHRRLLMADFPQGANIIENEYNGIAGFSINEHYFLPGFPVMAQPMCHWVLNKYYQQYFYQSHQEMRSILVFGLPESKIGPLMEEIETNFTGIKTYSLPSVRTEFQAAHIEFGLKTKESSLEKLEEAWQLAKHTLKQLGGTLQEIETTQ